MWLRNGPTASRRTLRTTPQRCASDTKALLALAAIPPTRRRAALGADWFGTATRRELMARVLEIEHQLQALNTHLAPATPSPAPPASATPTPNGDVPTTRALHQHLLDLLRREAARR
jgi:hypothetical protein